MRPARHQLETQRGALMLKTRFLAILTVAALAAFSASGALAQALTLRFAMITAETFPYMDGAKKFKELVEARSKGDIKVLLYPGGQLGDERQINEAILEGSVHIGVGAGAMAALAPIYNLVQMPFLIQGQTHMAAVADGPVGAKLAQRIEQQAGFKTLAWFSTGDSPIETVKKPVSTPADLGGVKIRAIGAPVMVDALRALGASPTPMAYLEVYTGLKQGIIEGAHLDVLSVDTLKVGEVIKYMTDWEQITFLSEPRPVIMSAKYFATLSPERQKLIQDAMKEAALHERKVFVEKMTTIRKKLVDGGVKISQVDAPAFLERVRPVWQKYATELKAEDLLSEILAMRK
jgi:tripartite ATP-independent transporter DctP family solute receptor